MKEQYTLVADKKQYDLLNEDPVIRTVTGKWVNVFNPKPEMFDIEDIAHSLSMQPRFSGHLPYHYSVAQHSIECHRLADQYCLSKVEKLTALMHDCSEAYLVDIPRPIKKQFSQYKVIENSLMNVLAGVFHFNWPLSEQILQIDNDMLQTEWDDLMVKIDDHPLNRLNVYSQSYAKQLFLDIFHQLTK